MGVADAAGKLDPIKVFQDLNCQGSANACAIAEQGGGDHMICSCSGHLLDDAAQFMQCGRPKEAILSHSHG
jgi:hypothetical protein